MKAAVIIGPSRICVADVETPLCPEGGMLTRVLACAICGSDLRMYDFGPIDGVSIHGHECVMQVIDIDPRTPGYARGDRVLLCPVTCGTCSYCLLGKNHLCTNKSAVRSVVQGGYAEYRPIGPEAISGGFVVPIPDDLDTERATVVEPLSCVLNGCEKLQVYPGKTVAIIGAGPIGNLHLQMARLRGASHTVLIDVLDHRLHMNSRSRPTHMINSSQTDPVAAVRSITRGRGADITIVACVSSEAQAQALRMTARGGEVCLFAGLPPSQSTALLDTNLIHNQEITVLGSRSSTRRHFELAIELIRNGQIDAGALISHVLPLESIDEGFRLVKTGEAMKVVIKP